MNDQLTTICAHVHALCGVPFYLFEKDESLSGCIPEWLRPIKSDFLRNLVERHIDEITAAPFLATYKNIYSLAVVSVRDGGWLLMGPVSGSETDQHPVYIYETQQGKRKTLIPPTPHLSYERFTSCVLLVAQLAQGKMYRPSDLVTLTDSFLPESTQSTDREQPAFQAEQTAYQGENYEQRLLESIEKGDYERAQRIMNTPSGIDVSRWSVNALRQEQYTFVCLMTMAVRAAIRGGMRSGDAFQVTDETCRRVDRAVSEQQVGHLAMDMVRQLCEGVAKSGNRALLSQTVRICCDYLNNCLYSDPDYTEPARLTGLSAHTVSDRFKEEMGLTMSQYLKSQRLKEAMHLLRYSDYTLSDISYMLHFSSQSHFTASFRAETGETPNQFRMKSKKISKSR